MTTVYWLSCVQVQAESWNFREPYLGSQVAEGLRNCLLKIWAFITSHYIILTSLLYRVQTLTSHDTEESKNCPESPHLGEIKRMHKQCVPGASPLFVRAGDEANLDPYTQMSSHKYWTEYTVKKKERGKKKTGYNTWEAKQRRETCKKQVYHLLPCTVFTGAASDHLVSFPDPQGWIITLVFMRSVLDLPLSRKH